MESDAGAKSNVGRMKDDHPNVRNDTPVPKWIVPTDGQSVIVLSSPLPYCDVEQWEDRSGGWVTLTIWILCARSIPIGHSKPAGADLGMRSAGETKLVQTQTESDICRGVESMKENVSVLAKHAYAIIALCMWWLLKGGLVRVRKKGREERDREKEDKKWD
ncbi:hypothetical protein BDQ17DRAFT_1440254 [Cyathus striatus]|nr:hypothetical protein BDQ17DRAFT_1440254 [Cyathus striatus]